MGAIIRINLIALIALMALLCWVVDGHVMTTTSVRLRSSSSSAEPTTLSSTLRFGRLLKDKESNGRAIQVEFLTASDEDQQQRTEAFTLQLDSGMFAADAKVQAGSSEFPITTQRTYIYVNSLNNEWATATIDAEGKRIVSGVFSSERIGGDFHVEASEAKPDDPHHHQLRRLTDLPHDFEDVVIESPEFKLRKQQKKQQQEAAAKKQEQVAAAKKQTATKKKKKNQKAQSNASVSKNVTSLPTSAPTSLIDASAAADSDNSNIWYPGCFPGDQAPLTVYISIATDVGFMNRVNAKNPSASLDDKMAVVLQAVESAISVVRPLYLAQLHVQLQVQKVVIGLSTDSSAILRKAREVPETCSSDYLGTLSSFSTWVKTQSGSAHWHMLTDCYPSGVIGVGYIGGLCSIYGNNVAFSSFTEGGLWLTVAHEIGHVFGAQHTFYRGLGGIMDYGSGRLNGGAVQFHPDNKEDMCDEISDAIKAQCKYAVITQAEALCGNGILEPAEQCECLTSGKQSCGACVKCALTSKRECSTASEGFVVRQASTPAYVATTDAAVLHSDPDCCIQGVLRGKSCNGGRDVCSATGICQKACYKFQLQPCGFDTSGCIQKCIYQGACYGADLTTMGPPPIPVGAVPDGLACKTSAGTSGQCLVGVCTAPTPRPTAIAQEMTPSPTTLTTTAAPTRKPTTTPSLAPISSAPTKSPTLSTDSPTTKLACPSTRSFLSCPSLKTASQCRSSSIGCAWCAKSQTCQATSLICSLVGNSDQIKQTYGHCEPFARSIEHASR